MQTLLAAGAIAAALAGGSLTAAGWWAYDNLIDDPGVITRERDRLTAEFVAETRRVVAAEQLRQFKIGELAFEQFYQAKQEDEAWEAAARNLYRMELQQYAQDLAADGGPYGLTQRDLDYLDGRILQPGGAVQGGE